MATFSGKLPHLPPCAAADAPLLQDLAAALRPRLANGKISIIRRRVWVTSEHVDFTLRPYETHSGDWTVACTATVREPAPGLGTWWADWHMRNVTIDELISELTTARETVERILLRTESRHSTIESTTDDAAEPSMRHGGGGVTARGAYASDLASQSRRERTCDIDDRSSRWRTCRAEDMG